MTNNPIQSVKTLVISLISAIVLAVFILLTIVGPAEFGLDPTGLGEKLGLTVLAQPLQQQNIKNVVLCPAGEQATDWSDIVIITIPAASGLEYKFNLKNNAELSYAWKTDGAELYFDFHGEPAGDKTGYFKSFKEATKSQSTGVLKVPFAGSHGWYWENKTQSPVRVTLKTKGQYTIKGLI